MTTRAIFNRQYTDFSPAGTQVWLVNGAGVTATPTPTETFTAGSSLLQGEAVYVSGAVVFPASAASGVLPDQYAVIGITANSASASGSVEVSLDGTAIIGPSNLVGESSLVPGKYYYLSKYTGKITQYTTTSGSITALEGYAALVNVGQALSTSELQVEIEPPIVLYDGV